MKIEYFIVLAFCLAAPLVLSFSKELDFHKYPLRLLLAVVLPLALFIPWDIIATARGHWSFNPEYIVGVKFYGLPLEEILFFIVIPFCGIFTWESVKYFMRKKEN